MTTRKEIVRIAAAADLHYSRTSQGILPRMFADLNERADVLLLCGDLTDHGLPEEAQIVVKELSSAVRIPMVGVLGNHDYESAKADEVRRICEDAGLRILDGDTFEVFDLGFAGVKGFAGGFGNRALQPWGEQMIKLFVHEALQETLKLETALLRLRTARRIALLHYSPIEATVAGEPPEIYAFLGSSRLEEPLNRYAVAAVFHGHAHHGSAEGRTSAGIPVYNVSQSLLMHTNPEQHPFRIVEVAIDTGDFASVPTAK
jgi:Icc-related predicted phosphoesterase